MFLYFLRGLPKEASYTTILYPRQAYGLGFSCKGGSFFIFGERKLERGVLHDYCSARIITNMSILSRDLIVTQTMKKDHVVLF